MAVAAQPTLRFHHNSAFFRTSPRLFRHSQSYPRPNFAAARIRASSAVALEPESTNEVRDTSYVDLFACPICYEPLIRKGPSGFNLPAIYRSAFKCKKCNKSYTSKNIYLDLTVTSGTKEYNEFKPAGTELFRSPLVSFVYERGWRQNFNTRGFPGPDEEVKDVAGSDLSTWLNLIGRPDTKPPKAGYCPFEKLKVTNYSQFVKVNRTESEIEFNMAQEYFKPAEGGVLVDVSCGSGLFSRKFAKSGDYSRVIALDFSENMLRQCFDFIKNDDTILSSNLALVRADVSRLPFSSGSVDAVHAGAALHCWPSPSNAVAEINRILRSGGVFVGTTFLRPTSSTSALLRQFSQRNYNYLTEGEIEDLCTSCGFVNYTKKIQQSFIMFSAQKP